MPDISMCGDESCPFSSQCRRHTDSGTVPHQNQSWMLWEKIGPPTDPNNCNGWYPIERGDDRD